MARVGSGLAADRSAAVIIMALTAAAAAVAAPVSSARIPGATRAQVPSSLRSSPELWATIDVCNPPDQHDTVGIRGSMPSDVYSLVFLVSPTLNAKEVAPYLRVLADSLEGQP